MNKSLFNMDCLGCGVQRSTALLLEGEFADAFKTYPAIYSLFILAIFLIANAFFKFKNASKIVSLLTILNIVIIVVSYILKINHLY